MRWLTLLLIGGLVLGVGAQAQAIVFNQPYQGPISMKFINWDVGTLYSVPDGTYTGGAALDGLTQTPPPNSFNGEDSWGVAMLTDIVGVNGNIPLWNWETAPYQVTALFHGEKDTYLKQTTDGSGNITQDIHGTGFEIAWYEDYNKDLGDPRDKYVSSSNVGTARRTSATTFEGATEGTLLWTLKSIPGFGPGTDEFFTTFSPSGNIIFSQFNAVGGMLADFTTLSVGTGAENPPNGFFLDSAGADWRIAFTGTQMGTPTGGFMVLSNDPITATAIPEPATLALVALGGLTVLFRRKRK
jgi:hypothetical protein